MKNKNSVLIFAAGISAFAWGAAAVYIDQRFSIPAVAIGLWGALALTVSLMRSGQRSQSSLMLSRLRKAGSILLATILLVSFFAGINYLAVRCPWRRDVTRAKQHTLASSTVAFIKNLQQDVQLSALYVGIPPTYLQDLFKEYEKASNGRINTEIIDPIEDIGYAAQFGNVIDGKQSKVVVRSGKERRDLDFTKAPLSEEELTTAVMRVTRAERQVCFLTGHGEYSLADKGDAGLTTLAKRLTDNNVVNREVMLGVEKVVPPDCDALIVAGPRQDLTEKEEAAIQGYLKRGGDALFLVENVIVTTPDKPLTEDELRKNPSLSNILNQWGVKVGEDVVVDLVNHAGDDVGSPATRNYAKHKALTEGLDYTFYVRPRSIAMLQDRRPSLKLAPIVMTAPGDKSWAETDRTLKVVFDPLLDTAGPVPIAFVIYDEKAGEMASGTRIIVFTDADFLTNIYIDHYSNAQMGLNVINWITESEAGVFLGAKEIKVERLDLTSKQKRQVAAVLFLMPLLIAAGGIAVWMKR